MPELPDVEVLRRSLRRKGFHRRIQRVSTGDGRILKRPPRFLRDRLAGRSLEATRRHGKYLFAGISGDNGWLILHFGMTGTLLWPEAGEVPRHMRLQLDFRDGGAMSYVCARRLGRVDWTPRPRDFVEQEGLGPDTWRISWETFRDALSGRTGTIKGTLMNQEVLAGLGNIYADEILFQARLDPRTPVADIPERTLRALHRLTGRVLRTAVRYRAEPERLPQAWLLPHRDEERPGCPRCSASLRRVAVSGRTTWLCPREQAS